MSCFGNLGHNLSAYKITISMLTLILINVIALSWAPTLRLMKIRGPYRDELAEDIESRAQSTTLNHISLKGLSEMRLNVEWLRACSIVK